MCNYHAHVITITANDAARDPAARAYALRVCNNVGLDPNHVNQVDIHSEGTVDIWAFVMRTGRWPYTFQVDGNYQGLVRIKRRFDLSGHRPNSPQACGPGA